MGMKMTYENNPNWNPRFVKKELIGGCRNAKDYCEGKYEEHYPIFCEILIRLHHDLLHNIVTLSVSTNIIIFFFH